MLPFENIKVIELSSVLAGPAVGMFFAELGAEVVKVENASTGGDVTRNWRLPQEDKERKYSAYYCSVNYGKRVLMLDLKSAEDYAILMDEMKDAEIVISNYRPAQAERLGVSYDILKRKFPGIILAELTGYGVDDKRPAFDMALQAEAGFLGMCGEPGREPVKMPVALIDILAAHQLKEGVLIAMMKKMRTGEGSLVRASLFETAVASLANQATNWLMNEYIPQPMGSLHPNIAPYGETLMSKDGIRFTLAVGSDKQFEGLCQVLGTDWNKQVEFSTNAKRLENRPGLGKKIKERATSFLGDELEGAFQKEGVPYGRIRNMKEVFETEKAQAMILENQMPDGGIAKRVKTVAFDIF